MCVGGGGEVWGRCCSATDVIQTLRKSENMQASASSSRSSNANTSVADEGPRLP